MACYHWRTRGRSIDTCAKQDDDYWSSVRPDLKTCFPSKVKLQTQWIRSYFSHVSFRVSKTVIIGLPHHGDGIRSTWASRFDWIFAARKIGYDGWTWVGVAHRAGGASYGLLQVCRCTSLFSLVRKGGAKVWIIALSWILHLKNYECFVWDLQAMPGGTWNRVAVCCFLHIPATDIYIWYL